jgi:AICAR transformylase/IMP cyclohydrolase PurH
VGFNTPVTVAACEAMKGVFYEVMIAPGINPPLSLRFSSGLIFFFFFFFFLGVDYEPAALEILTKRQKLRVLKVNNFHYYPTALEIRNVSGGALLQTPNPLIKDEVSN